MTSFGTSRQLAAAYSRRPALANAARGGLFGLKRDRSVNTHHRFGRGDRARPPNPLRQMLLSAAHAAPHVFDHR